VSRFLKFSMFELNSMSLIDGDGQELDSLRAEMKLLLSQLRSELTLSNQLENQLLSKLQEQEETDQGDQPALEQSSQTEVASEVKTFENELSPLQTVMIQMADLFFFLFDA
jgi:hypothetical protein